VSAAIAVGLASGLVGCNQGMEDMTKEQKQTTTQLGEIATRTGGDWQKATPEDREFLKKLSYGNEVNAQKLLATAAGKPPSGGQAPPRAQAGK